MGLDMIEENDFSRIKRCCLPPPPKRTTAIYVGSHGLFLLKSSQMSIHSSSALPFCKSIKLCIVFNFAVRQHEVVLGVNVSGMLWDLQHTANYAETEHERLKKRTLFKLNRPVNICTCMVQTLDRARNKFSLSSN